jgi:hypothetical protein
MKGTVKNIDYFKKKFIEKANKKHNNLYNYVMCKCSVYRSNQHFG